MTNFVTAMHDPAGTYKTPHEVVSDDTLTIEEKIKVLEQWEYDARVMQVAEEENMPGEDPTMLSRIHNALTELKDHH